jgi:hypothetical protein
VVGDGGQEEILNTRQLRSLKNTKTGKKGRGGFLPGLAFQLWNSYEFFFSRSFCVRTEMKVGQTYRFEIPAFPGFTSQLRLHAVLPSSWRSCCNSLSPSIILGLWASRDTASSKQVTGQNSPEFQTGRFPPFSNRCPHFGLRQPTLHKMRWGQLTLQQPASFRTIRWIFGRFTSSAT